MRVTNSMYYRDMYGENNKIGQALFDVNKQISSGQKIQYAYEDAVTFIDTMRLDNEVTTLTQVKASSESGYKFSTQTDTVLGDFTKTLDSIKTKLVQAATASHSVTSMQAIANDLRGLETHLKNLSNTSINGKYLFSGSQTSTKPIGSNGEYQGNNEQLTAFLGYGISQQYNISGVELFLGNENTTARKVSTNVRHLDLAALYPDVMENTDTARSASEEHYITTESTIRDLMGDIDTDTTNDSQSYFYIRATGHDGTAFKSKIAMNSDESVGDLIDQIENEFLANGNTSVDITINEYGQFEIEDKNAGSSKLDFHIVGAVDFDQTNDVNGDGNNDDADVDDIDLLAQGETDFGNIADGVSTATNTSLHVREFIKSDYKDSAGNDILGYHYDRTAFEVDGAFLKSSIAQIVKSDNSYAVDSTLLSEVASGSSLDGTTLMLEGTDINGSAFTLQIDLQTAGSTFSLDGGTTNYDIFNNASPRVATPADEMTYRQLMDVVNMVVTDNLPATVSTDTDYDAAIEASYAEGATTLKNGKIVFEDLTATATQATMTLYDSNTNDFTASASTMTFNANNALTIRDPQTDFFAQLDEAISAVEEMRYRADGDNTDDPRNVGIQNGIQIIDDLNEHVARMQTKAGSQSQSLDASVTRTDMLLINTKTLRSEVLDTDIAEATLTLQQLQLNYQAMFSTISKVSKLSLVNYI